MKLKPAYIAFVKTLPCCHCYATGADPHHIISIGMGMMGGKANDLHTMPLCRVCHDEVHREPKAYPQIKWMIQTQLKALEAGVLKV